MRRAAAQFKTGMVPGATQGVADHQALGQRAVVVCAPGADGMNAGAAFHQHDVVFAQMATKGCILLQLAQRQSRADVRAQWLFIFARHYAYLTVKIRNLLLIKQNTLLRRRGRKMTGYRNFVARWWSA